jgi:hypothetical protein
MVPQRQFDETRQLARPVGGRAVVCLKYLTRDRSHPPRPPIKGAADPVDEGTFVPHAG